LKDDLGALEDFCRPVSGLSA